MYAYRFDWDEEPTLLGADSRCMLGAAHGFEIPFVFGHWDLGREGNLMFTEENEPGREELSARDEVVLGQLAYTGAPGRGREATCRRGRRGTTPNARRSTWCSTPRRAAACACRHETESTAALVAELAARPEPTTRDARCALLDGVGARRCRALVARTDARGRAEPASSI